MLGLPLFLSVGCSADDAQPTVVGAPLIEEGAWEIVELETDPFSGSLDERILCTWAAVREEPNGVEVDTSECGYVTLTQPSLVETSSGDKVTVRLAWATLVASEPSEARVVVRLGESSVLDLALPVPSEAGVEEVTVPLESGHPGGTPIYFHVENHGSNTYRLSELSLNTDAKQP